MTRAPFQVLVLAFRRGETIEYALLKRQDMGIWQGVAGGGEDSETPAQAARREAHEELGIPADLALYPLQTTSSIPARFFADQHNWPGFYVIPEYTFGMDVTGHKPTPSAEHTQLRWAPCEEAASLLTWDSNKTALGELHERLMHDALPPPAPM